MDGGLERETAGWTAEWAEGWMEGWRWAEGWMWVAWQGISHACPFEKLWQVWAISFPTWAPRCCPRS